MKLYSIYDVVSVEFSTPFMAKNDEAAKRIFFGAFGTDFYMEHKNDFECYCIGKFDIETGEIVPVNKKLVMRGCEITDA